MAPRKKVVQKTIPLPDGIHSVDQLFESTKGSHTTTEAFQELRNQWKTLRDTLKQKIEHEQLLLETARYLTAFPDEKNTLTRIATGAMRVLNSDEADIYLLSEDGRTLNPMVAIGPQYIDEILNTTLQVDKSLTGKAVKSKHSVIVNDISGEPAAFQIPNTPVDTEERLIIAPLMDEKEVMGALCVTRLGALFSNEDLRLAEAYAAFASTVMINTRTHAALEKEIEERIKIETALRESESKYRELTDFLPQIIFEMDLAGNLTFINKYAFSAMRYDEEDFRVGMNALQMIVPEDRERAMSNILRLLDLDRYPAQEFLMVRKDGSQFPAIILASPIIHDGKSIGFRGFIIDITDRKASEEALRKSEESYRGLFNSVHEGIYIQDHEGRFLDVNDGAVKMYGYPRTYFIGKTPEIISAPGKNNLDEIVKAVAKAFSGETQQFEFWGQRSNGEVFPEEVRFYPGNYYGMNVIIAVATDITDRKRAEDALRASEERFRALIQNSTDIIAVLGDDYRIQYCTPSVQNVLGYSPDQMLNESLDRFIHPDDMELAMHDLDDRESFGKAPTELRARKSDGTYIVIESLAQDCLNTPGINGIVVTVRDITERKRTQERIQQASKELAAAYEATLEGWSHALEMRERETAGHSRRVADLTVELAKSLGVPSDQFVHIRRGAILHDIGKLSIPDRILLKPETLDEDEWVIMRQHTIFANELLSPIRYLEPALEIPCAHHERWDGSGYPHGMKGEEIPMAARIFAVVDEWDALTSDRPYRRAWTRQAAMKYLSEHRGKKFDPVVIDAFMKLIQRRSSKGEKQTP